ncbi:hypothetical protein ACLOJK_031568 [Asimina triloba]
MGYRIDQILWMTLLIRKLSGDYQTLVSRGNSKAVRNLPDSNKDWKLQFFFAKLVELGSVNKEWSVPTTYEVQLEKIPTTMLAQKKQEVVFKAMTNFLEEGSLKWFKTKKKFFS